jgi:glycosyltransferase involved in cell wall biosynthesis
VKVALDSRLSADLGGVGRYSRRLLQALRATAAANDVVIDTNRPSSAVRGRDADVYHAPWLEGAMLHSPCPMVVTIHDVAQLKRRSEHLRTSLRLRLRPLAVQRAAAVIVPSEAVAEDALLHLRLQAEQIVVIPEAADASMQPRGEAEIAEARARFGLPERYLLWVGSLQHPAAHVAKLAAAPRELPLVMVGATRPWAHELPDVILTGQVTDAELSAIYSGAHALVISSGEEGLGLPAVEALACGTPVVAVEGPALREVLGERASFVAAGDMRALLAAGGAATRPAPEPSPWSWEDAALATWGVYARALARPEAPRLPRAGLRQRPAGGV